MTLYRKVFKEAWIITWRNKYLWFFGLFATLLGNSGEYRILSDAFSLNINRPFFPAWQRIVETGIFDGGILANIGNIIENDPFSFVILLLVYLLITVLFGLIAWLTIVSQVAIVNNSAGLLAGLSRRGRAARGKCFRDGLGAGIKNFWPVLGLNIINKLIILFVFFIVSLLAVLVYTQSGSSVSYSVYLASFVIFVPLAIALSFIIKYAIVYVVVKGKGLAEAIEAGWRLFIKNWLVSIEMAFILFFITFAVVIGWFLAVSILTVPFLFLAFIFYKLSLLTIFWMMMIFAAILVLASLILVGVILTTFQISSWTNLFIELVGKGGTSKIVRVVSGLMEGK